MLAAEEVLADEEDGIGGVVCVVVDAGGTVEVLVAVDSVADEVALDSSLRESEIDSVDPGAEAVLFDLVDIDRQPLKCTERSCAAEEPQGCIDINSTGILL